jgi:hypothetical protein
MYEVIISAYVNEVFKMTFLIIYAHYCYLWNESEHTSEESVGLSYGRSIPYMIQQFSPGTQHHCIHQGIHSYPKMIVQRH